jgi:lipoprotein-anchoring transpeptidase ErfK/SrfK
MPRTRSFARGIRTRPMGLLVVLSLTAAMFAVAAPPAWAMKVSAPPDVLGSVDVSASLTASDPVGLAMLLVDGSVARSVLTTGAVPRSFGFDGLSLTPGSHTLRLAVRSSDGLSSTAAISVVSWQRPVPPTLMSPSNGYGARSQGIVVKAGPGTSRISLTVNGHAISAKAVVPGQIVNMGTVGLGAGVNSIQLDASNPVSKTTGIFRVKRLDYPWPTCIVIVKHEFRLYWVRDGFLVKAYPIAIGKPSTPTPSRTWRIDAKYITDWGGVYGPRKMRLFKQVGPDSFTYTGYGIHGTNQEWVIGTAASHGCIRMYNRDIMQLFPQVPLGTMVQTRN